MLTSVQSYAVAGSCLALAAQYLAALLLLTVAVQVSAQDYNEGKQAYLAKDYDKALAILQPLAEQGDSDAQVTLGLMYDYGHGVEQDSAKAIEWYTKAAEQGLPVVQHDLGVKYFQGKGVARDYQLAARWWEQAANAGLADSQFNLGLMYYRGLGIKQNYTRALDLFQRAAGQDHANAQYSLAVMYAFGQGVDKDYGRALKLFRAAANQGVAQAQYNLGVFYENGYGVDKDPNRAREWYQKAADQDVDKANERLTALDVAGDGEPGTAEPSMPASEAAVATSGETQPREETPAESAAGELRRDSWARRQSADHYTLQLISLTDEKAVRDYLLDNGLAERGGYIAVLIDNVRRYNAIYGYYESYDEAEAAIDNLPAEVRRTPPWVRNFGVLQKIMQ
ncbi:MAG: hypothetical protein U5P41_15090 [Gammaproteobacteria bacterium]|nr:hypothetical protein [Gammaproteobacteria bacterium]